MGVLTKTQRNHHRFLARFNREVSRETERGQQRVIREREVDRCELQLTIIITTVSHHTPMARFEGVQEIFHIGEGQFSGISIGLKFLLLVITALPTVIGIGV
jgi:hypothetical protein